MDHPTKPGVEAVLVAHLKQLAKGRGKPVRAIDMDRPFFEAGILDSLSLLDFVAFVEKQYGIDIAGSDIVPENFETLRVVTEYIVRRLHGAAKQTA